MAESLKAIKNRIRSIESIKKITRAMQMVSLAKLRPCENKLSALRVYLEKLRNLLGCVLAESGKMDNPFLIPALKPPKRIALCVISSDSGLCGTYNQNIFRSAENFIAGHKDFQVSIIAVGRKGFNYFKKKNFSMPLVYVEPQGNYAALMLDKMISDLTKLFLARGADEIYLAYARFVSASRQEVKIEKFLSIDYAPDLREEYILEPDAKSLLDEIIPAYISAKMKACLLEAKTSEHAARIISMSEATSNAEELLDNLILLRNKVRQAGITRELIEIISSAEALKG